MRTEPSRRLVSLALVAALTGGTLVACSTDSTPSAGSTPTSASTSTSDAAVATTTGPALSVDPVATTWREIDREAVTLFDAALAKDWATIEEQTSALSGAVAGLPSEKGVVPDDLSASVEGLVRQLEQAADQRKEVEVAQVANDITGAVAQADSHLMPTKPVEVGRVGVAARQLVLDGDAGDWSAAQATLDRAVQDVDAARTTVQGHGGSDLLKTVDGHLSRIGEAIGAKDAAAVRIQATEVLMTTDALGLLFL